MMKLKHFISNFENKSPKKKENELHE